MQYKRFLGGLFFFVILCVFLQATNNYHYFYIEQFQLFLFSNQYIMDKLAGVGGFSVLLSEFLIQFFAFPYLGSCIISFVLVIICLLTRTVLKQIAPFSDFYALCFLPSLALLLMHFDHNYFLQGTIAYLLFLLFLNLYLCISDFRYRLFVGLFLLPILFLCGGAIVTLFVICIFIHEIIKCPRKSYLSILMLLELLCLGVACVHQAILPDYRFAFLPDAYYLPLLTPPALIYFSWIIFPVLLLVAFLCGNVKITTTKSRIINNGVQLLLVALLCLWSIPRYNKADSYQLKKLDHYTRTEQWDQIIEESAGPLNNYLYLCHLNLALMERGELADRLFFFDQHGVDGLMRPWDKTFVVSNLLSDIYFSLGDIALAQRTAFEALMTVPGDANPRNLKRLIQTNLIYGTYPIAEKYISILEKTFAYKDWAAAHRKYLYNDEAVESDPLLGAKRQGLTTNNHMSQLDGVIPDLIQQAEENPSNQLPIQFVGVTYLLSKDLASFQQMIEKYYGTPVLPALPHSFQEAVIMLSENDPDYWRHFNVSDVVIQRFMNYRETVLRNRNNAQALPALLRNSYANTYWYYYIYK
ncbi:DUF6057 family protein [Parabacteroides sp. OttesenSCG-928-G07]|nr:DUF6057 family protein [Parabacteroides sp. OttesenSCG-928-G07]